LIQEQALPKRGFAGIPVKFLLAGALIAAGVVYLIVTALGGATVYYMTVSELRAQGTQNGPVRVAGVVSPDQLSREGTSLAFAINDEATGEMLPVVYKGVVPDIFAPGIQVVVEGRLGNSGTMEATTLLAKCPSRFSST
jgi:cytochrome c-type biogenesis protein CcmE